MKNFQYAGCLLLVLFVLLFAQTGWQHVVKLVGMVGAVDAPEVDPPAVEQQFVQELREWRRVPRTKTRPSGPARPISSRNLVRLSSRSAVDLEAFRGALGSGLPVSQLRQGRQLVHASAPLRDPDLQLTSSLRLGGQTIYTYRRL